MKCECCGTQITFNDVWECPVCNQLVCCACFDGEMCDDCRDAFNSGHPDGGL